MKPGAIRQPGIAVIGVPAGSDAQERGGGPDRLDHARRGRSRCRRSRPQRPSPGSVRNGSSRQVTIVPRKAMLSGVSLMPASHLVARANPDRVWRRTADTSAVAMDARGAQPYRTGMVRFRRFAALVAAYAIALQALFAAFALPSHVARAGAASICLSSEDGGTPSPQSGHDPCAMCLAGQCSHLLGAVPRCADAHRPRDRRHRNRTAAAPAGDRDPGDTSATKLTARSSRRLTSRAPSVHSPHLCGQPGMEPS